MLRLLRSRRLRRPFSQRQPFAVLLGALSLLLIGVSADAVWAEKPRYAITIERALSGMASTGISEPADLLLKQGAWKHYQRKPFHFFYRSSAHLRAVSGRAHKLASMIRTTLNQEGRVADKVTRINVFLVDGLTWECYFGSHISGFADPEHGEVFVNMDLGSRSSAVFTHELAHALLHQKSCQCEVPRWLDEGFAMQASGIYHGGSEIDGLSGQARSLISQGFFIPLRDLMRMTEYPDNEAQRFVFYYESEFTFLLLKRFFGRASTGPIVRSFAFNRNRPLEAQFENLLQSTHASRVKSFAEFEKRWKRELGF